MNYVNDYKLRPTKVEMQQFPINSPEMPRTAFKNESAPSPKRGSVLTVRFRFANSVIAQYSIPYRDPLALMVSITRRFFHLTPNLFCNQETDGKFFFFYCLK